MHPSTESQASLGRQTWFEDMFLPATFWALLGGYAVFTVLSLFGGTVGEFDDAIPLLHGALVNQGRTPNLDFYSFYPPLNAYVNAGMFALLGRSVIAARLVTSAIYLVVLLLTMRVLRSRLNPVPVLLPAALLLLATSIGAAIGLPAFPGFALALSTLLLYLDSDNRLIVTALSGVLGSIALLYRINFGAYAIAVIAIDLVLRDRFKRATAFFLPFLVCTAVLCLLIYGRKSGVAISEFVLTAQRLMALRGFITLRFSTGIACAVVLPCAWFFFAISKNSQGLAPKDFVPAGLGLCLLLLALGGSASVSIVPIVIVSELLSVLFLQLFVFRLPRAEFSILLFFCCVLHYFLSRADWAHWLLLPVCACLLFLFGVLGSEGVRWPVALALITAAAFVLIATEPLRPVVSYAKSGVHLLVRLMSHPHLADTNEVLDYNLPAAGWATVYTNRDELAALQYVRARTSDSDPIFVGVQNHSRIFYNDLRMYWLAGRPIGARTFQLETRVATEADVQRGIIKDLQQNKVRWIILDDAPQWGDETFMRQGYRGSKMLDDFIASHYVQISRFGQYAVLTRGNIGSSFTSE